MLRHTTPGMDCRRWLVSRLVSPPKETVITTSGVDSSVTTLSSRTFKREDMVVDAGNGVRIRGAEAVLMAGP